MPRWVVAAYTAELSRTKARFAGELLFSCLRPPERHTAGSDAGIEEISPVTSQACSATIKMAAGDNQDGYLRHRLNA